MTDVSYAAGFASIRQFNDTMREIFASTPSDLRRARGAVLAPSPCRRSHELRLPYRRPADLTGIVAFLSDASGARRRGGRGGTYRRSLVLPHGTGVAELTPGTAICRPPCDFPTFVT